ncbi:MAG: hypothetical protein E7162_04940 [Firmicutes bacterium]|nr:hypothetical protein [Bacillota bacterium]
MNPNVDEVMETINKEYFDNLLKEIHHDVILVAARNLRDTEKIATAVNENWPEGKEWLNGLNDLANRSATAIEEYYAKIETDINKIFVEWEKYQNEKGANE